MAKSIYDQDPRKVVSILNGKAYNYGGDVLGSAKGVKIGSTYNGMPKTGNYQSTGGYSAAAIDQQIRATQAETAALLKSIAASQPAVPRLPDFNYGANYAKSQKMAAKAVNPKYKDNLKRYLEGKKIRVNQQKVTTQRSKEDIASELSQTLEDTGTNRLRTEEDVTNKLGDITANENSYQQQEGRQFDRARAALLGDNATSGLTESGIGQGRVANAVTDRNLASEDQVREFSKDKRNTEIFRTRTLADLDTTDVRAKGGAQRRTEDQDIALKNFVELENFNEKDFRVKNEGDRVLELMNAQESAWNKIIKQTARSLAGSGRKAQDIEYFLKFYG